MYPPFLSVCPLSPKSLYLRAYSILNEVQRAMLIFRQVLILTVERIMWNRSSEADLIVSDSAAFIDSSMRLAQVVVQAPI